MSNYLRDRRPGASATAPRRHRFLTFTLLLALGAPASTALASARSANLAEMAARAGRVVHGRISEVRAGQHPSLSHVEVVFVTLDVIEMLKGPSAPRVTFMQFAGAGRSVRNFHLPEYKVGEEVVLFLYPESRHGLTSPVAEGQGKFLVRHDARAGRRLLFNDRGNRALFARVDASKLQTRLSLNQAERGLLARQEGAAELDSFRSLVRKLAANQAAVN